MSDSRTNLIKAGRLALGVAAFHPVGEPTHAPAADSESAADTPRPTISLIRDGDVVRAIEVTCPCGHTTIIECDYGEEDES